MRRTSPFQFTLAAAVSLALCVGTAVLWVRSYSYTDCVTATTDMSFKGNQGRFEAWTAFDKFVFSFTFISGASAARGFAPGFRRYSADTRGEPDLTGLWFRSAGGGGFGGFWWVRLPHPASPVYQSGTDYKLAVPAWLPAVLFLCGPVWAATRLRRRKSRADLGLCPRCGYDLTGNESGRCPECGTPINKGET